MTKPNIIEADHTYNEWLRNLDMFEQELDVLQQHLDQIGDKAAGENVTSKIDAYQARIKGQKQNIDHLRNSIQANIDEIAERTQHDGEWYVENELGQQYHKLHEEFSAEVREMNKLKQDVNQFSTTHS